MIGMSSRVFVLLSMIALLVAVGCKPDPDITNQCEDCEDVGSADTAIDSADTADIDDGEPDAEDGESDADVPDVEGGEPDVNEECVPECGESECGVDPVCGESCGECVGSAGCEEGVCVVPESQVTWRVDGTVVHESTSVELAMGGGQYTVQIYMPDQGRSIQISASGTSGQGYSLSCDDANWTTTALMGLNTFDNGWAGLDDVPSEWKGLLFNNSHCGSESSSGDQVTRWNLTISEASSGQATGSFEMTIEGVGERAGSTLEIDGEFDTVQ